jgi:hypothetical protein
MIPSKTAVCVDTATTNKAVKEDVWSRPDDPLDKEEDKMWAVGLDLLVYSINWSFL